MMSAISSSRADDARGETLDIYVGNNARIDCDATAMIEALRKIIETVMRSAALTDHRWVRIRASAERSTATLLIEERNRAEASPAGQSAVACRADIIEPVRFDEAIEQIVFDGGSVEVTRDEEVGLSVRITLRVDSWLR